MDYFGELNFVRFIHQRNYQVLFWIPPNNLRLVNKQIFLLSIRFENVLFLFLRISIGEKKIPQTKQQKAETKKIQWNWNSVNIRWERIEHEMCLVSNKKAIALAKMCIDIRYGEVRWGKKSEWKLSRQTFLSACQEGFLFSEIFRWSFLFDLLGTVGLLGDR